MQNTSDYSDELSTLKELHEENTGRKFSDDEFNQIFEVAQKSAPNLFKIADEFQSDMMGLLISLEDATHRWEEVRLVSNVKGNPKEDIKKMMNDLKRIIEFISSNKNPNWSDVATLAHIHEALGEKLYEKYDKHTEYSKSIEEGMKRHTEASQNLWLQAEDIIKKLDPNKYLPDLVRWRSFFSDLLEGFQGTLHTINKEKLSKPKSLREEAIELAKKLGDDELVAYLKNAPMKTIQRRIQALREEAAKKPKNGAYKKTSSENKYTKKKH